MSGEQAPLAGLSSSQVGGILDALSEPAVVIRKDFTIVAANQAYAAAYHGSAAQLAGKKCHLVAHGHDAACSITGARCPVEGWQPGARCISVTHDHRSLRGAVRREDVTAYPIVDERGRTNLFLELVRTQRQEAAPEAFAIGRSPTFARVCALIERVAPTDMPVLLLGESGTGKELAASAIHAQSNRRDGKLVPLECSSLPEALFESELLGHERGAFTGASQAKRGLVETAAGGTLFLDEIGDVPLALQVKLLRLLETGVYRRVGSTEPRRASFRLVCATHRDLSAMVCAGTFRSDLYYRISAFPIRMPPLRERLSDLPTLADHLLDRIAPERRMRLHADALAVLMQHTFPGNVRELLNILNRAVLLADDDVIRPAHLSPLPDPTRSTVVAPPELALTDAHPILPLEQAERLYLRWALSRLPNARGELASRLGISERTLFRKLSGLRDATEDPLLDCDTPCRCAEHACASHDGYTD